MHQTTPTTRYRRVICLKCGQDLTRHTARQSSAHMRQHEAENAAMYDFLLGTIAIIAGGVGLVLIPLAISAALNHSPKALPLAVLIAVLVIAFYWLIERESKPCPRKGK